MPAFIYTPGMEHQEITKITQSIDLLPTVANLFGLDAPNCYIGNDILDENYGGFAYFADSSWFDGQLFYIPSLTEVTEANMEHVKRNAARVEKLLTVNDVVVAGDYFDEYK